MSLVLYLLTALGFLGAFDTLYYHEWRAKLPALGRAARSELQLHAWRDFVYTVMFFTLPWIAWQGRYVIVLAGLLLTEVVLTLWDFVVEDWIRKPLGGLYPGERVMHAIMGIVYGAMIASIFRPGRIWWTMPTALVKSPPPFPEFLRWTLTAMAVGILLSGIRDLYASAGLPGSAWPWKSEREAS